MRQVNFRLCLKWLETVCEVQSKWGVHFLVSSCVNRRKMQLGKGHQRSLFWLPTCGSCWTQRKIRFENLIIKCIISEILFSILTQPLFSVIILHITNKYHLHFSLIKYTPECTIHTTYTNGYFNRHSETILVPLIKSRWMEMLKYSDLIRDYMTALLSAENLVNWNEMNVGVMSAPTSDE